MPANRQWLVTDAASDHHLETFSVAWKDLPESPHHDWSIQQRRLKGGLCDGVDVISVDNGALQFDILPTRGMGLWRGQFRNLPLGWKAPVVGPVHPKFVNLADRNGLGWLTGFNEWLCRCGLNSNGPPGDDAGTPLTLHGRIANLPAQRVEFSIDTEPPFGLSVTGVVEEGGLFLGRLRLTTTYRTFPGSNRLEIHDTVENCGSRPAEMQMLYHLNVGAPFLSAGSTIQIPFRELAPHTDHAGKALDQWSRYGPPVSGFVEEVFDFLPAVGPDSRSLALLCNQESTCGLAVRWDVSKLPFFTLWKNTAAEADGYVTGLEPGTNFPFFKGHERSQGRVVGLKAGESWTASLEIEIADSTDAVRNLQREIASIQDRTPPTTHSQPVWGAIPKKPD